MCNKVYLSIYLQPAEGVRTYPLTYYKYLTLVTFDSGSANVHRIVFTPILPLYMTGLLYCQRFYDDGTALRKYRHFYVRIERYEWRRSIGIPIIQAVCNIRARTYSSSGKMKITSPPYLFRYVIFIDLVNIGYQQR